MKAIIKNIILLVIIFVLSYFSASCFGNFYNKFSPPTDGTLMGLSNEAIGFITGVPFAYIFFVVLLFKVFGEGNKKKWILWLLLPAGLFFAAGDLKHIYLPVALGLVAWILAKVVQTILVRIKLR